MQKLYGYERKCVLCVSVCVCERVFAGSFSIFFRCGICRNMNIVSTGCIINIEAINGENCSFMFGSELRRNRKIHFMDRVSMASH